MATHVRHPIWLGSVARPGIGAFALLFAIESFARAILATVIPLQAFAILQSSRSVSLLFTCVGIAGLVGSLFIPFLIRLIPRRWVYTLGALGLVLAAALFALDGVHGLLAGLIVRVLAVACLNVTLNLYIMDTIRRGDLVRSEPFRLAVSGGAWTLCPSLGVLLYDRVGAIAADGLSAAAAVLLLAAFWTIRLSDNPAIAAARRPPGLPNPLRSIGRFLAQPRLRLGWLIAFGRSSWWAQFFTFTPLYLVISGHSELMSAVVISLANAMLFLTVVIGRFAQRVGVRLVIVAAYLLTGATMLTAALFATIGWSVAVAALLLLAGAWVSGLDAVGNIPFLRAVRARERAAMTTVFRTYIDLSELLPSALFALLLSFFGLEIVFAATGCWMIAIGLAARLLPRAM
ncbi:MAG TPA: MFS transporter [Geminicoccaceae bacterium]|nr:MFS transporter [Geminicoccaceae bacterium]